MLRGRDLSAVELDRRLATKGFADAEREEALATLERTGLLDDRRFAEARAAALAGRGAGDALVRHELERAGVEDEVVEDALALLEPETERARRIVERRGRDAKTARYLVRQGFSQDSLGALVASASADELG